MISLEGSIVDLVTPFGRDGIDERGFADFVDWQIAEGSNGLATGTTTGEGPTLTDAEKDRLIRICVEVSDGRVPVIAATGTNGTDGTIALTRMAKAAGADAVLIVTPSCSRPSQEGMYRHFEAVARAVDVPIVMHNVPARTGVDLMPATLGRLSRMASIVGICDQGDEPCTTDGSAWPRPRTRAVKTGMPAVRTGFQVSDRLPMVAETQQAENAVTGALESLLADSFWNGNLFAEGNKSECSRLPVTGT